jgi:hypothetical protein
MLLPVILLLHCVSNKNVLPENVNNDIIIILNKQKPESDFKV